MDKDTWKIFELVIVFLFIFILFLIVMVFATGWVDTAFMPHCVNQTISNETILICK
jgi:uncharacterized membrane protein (DUF485 family)